MVVVKAIGICPIQNALFFCPSSTHCNHMRQDDWVQNQFSTIYAHYYTLCANKRFLKVWLNQQFKKNSMHKVKDHTNSVQVATHSVNGHALRHYVLLGNANYFEPWIQWIRFGAPYPTHKMTKVTNMKKTFSSTREGAKNVGTLK